MLYKGQVVHHTAESYFQLLCKVSREDGFPSVGQEESCLYRGPGGKKCAAGHLIPDSIYKEEMENHLFEYLWEKHPQVREHLPIGMTMMDIAKVQNVHDNLRHKWDHAKFVKELKSRIEVFANMEEHRAEVDTPQA